MLIIKYDDPLHWFVLLLAFNEKKQIHFKYYSFLDYWHNLLVILLISVLRLPKILPIHIHHKFHFPKHIIHSHLRIMLMCEILQQIFKLLFYYLNPKFIMGILCLHYFHDHIILYCKKLLHLPKNKFYHFIPKQLNENLRNLFIWYSYHVKLKLT